MAINMKQKIDPKDILKGDKIRVEGGEVADDFTAMEYVAQHDEHSLPSYWSTYNVTGYYLLERPEPPFEPYWGMVIREEGTANMAYYLPEEEGRPGAEWILETRNYMNYQDNAWAKKMLSEGWVVIEKPEGVK